MNDWLNTRQLGKAQAPVALGRGGGGKTGHEDKRVYKERGWPVAPRAQGDNQERDLRRNLRSQIKRKFWGQGKRRSGTRTENQKTGGS